MKKSDCNKITKATLELWAERNRGPGVLPCIPVILINSLCGEKAGITMNIVQQIPLRDIASILKAALDQVESRVKEMESN